MFIESHEILKLDRGPESFIVSWGFTKNSILSTGAVEFEFEWEAASRLRPEGRQRQANNPWERQTDCGPKADIGKPQPVGTASRLRPAGQQRQADNPRETVEETVGREPMRARTLRLNLFGATLFEFEIELGAWRPAWPQPPSGSHHHPGSTATHAAETDNWEAISRERGSRVAETTIVRHRLPWSVATRAAEAAIGNPPSPVCI